VIGTRDAECRIDLGDRTHGCLPAHADFDWLFVSTRDVSGEWHPHSKLCV